MFAEAARGKTGMPALHAMGDAYETVMADRDRLMLMLKCWASCDDPEICEAFAGPGATWSTWPSAPRVSPPRP